MPERPDWKGASERLDPSRFKVFAETLRPDDDAQRDMEAKRLGSVAAALLAAAPDAETLHRYLMKEYIGNETYVVHGWLYQVGQALRGEPTP